MLKLDRFSCSQKIQLKWDPPVQGKEKKHNFGNKSGLSRNPA